MSNQITIGVDTLQSILDQVDTNCVVEFTMRRNGDVEIEFDAYRAGDITIDSDDYVEVDEYKKVEEELQDLRRDYENLEEERDKLLADQEKALEMIKETTEQVKLLKREIDKSWVTKLRIFGRK